MKYEDGHDSDCATHNEPATTNGPCDCGAFRIPVEHFPPGWRLRNLRKTQKGNWIARIVLDQEGIEEPVAGRYSGKHPTPRTAILAAIAKIGKPAGERQ
jgi:hypothetical protein